MLNELDIIIWNKQINAMERFIIVSLCLMLIQLEEEIKRINPRDFKTRN